MRTILISIVVLAVVFGCSKPSSNTPAEPASPAASSSRSPAGGGGGDTVTPLGGPELGGATPVAGGDNLGETTGGGIGSAAKDMARRAAGQAGGAGM